MPVRSWTLPAYRLKKKFRRRSGSRARSAAEDACFKLDGKISRFPQRSNIGRKSGGDSSFPHFGRQVRGRQRGVDLEGQGLDLKVEGVQVGANAGAGMLCRLTIGVQAVCVSKLLSMTGSNKLVNSSLQA